MSEHEEASTETLKMAMPGLRDFIERRVEEHTGKCMAGDAVVSVRDATGIALDAAAMAVERQIARDAVAFEALVEKATASQPAEPQDDAYQVAVFSKFCDLTMEILRTGLSVTEEAASTKALKIITRANDALSTMRGSGNE